MSKTAKAASKSAKPKAAKAKKAQREFDDKLDRFCENIRKQHVIRFGELIEEHGSGNVIVFPVNDSELAMLKLASQVYGKGNVHDYAKNLAVTFGTSDTEEIAMQLKNGSRRLTGKGSR